MTPVRAVIEDENNFAVHVIKLPEKSPQDHLKDRWEVPLTDALTGEVDRRPWRSGEVWIGESPGKQGKIVVTSVPSILETADDARRLAAALLAAADRKDERDG